MKPGILTPEQAFGPSEASDEKIWHMQAAAAFAIEHSNDPSAVAARNYFRREDLPPQVLELLNTYNQSLLGSDESLQLM